MGFSRLISFQLDYAPQYRITKYFSARTGLQLVHIDHKSSPLVQGYFAVATECTTDAGTPHTLEHLIFMGSHKHPYKGLLDTAGNLCMSSTNAWTATDQTVYTLTTAGWQGFKTLLPIYLDHVLHPTLTDEACVTEVYHVDPDGLTDKGVVYSEMEAIESQSWFVTMLEKQRMLFPVGSGYRSETGGLTDNLRDLTNEEICKFHRDLYSSDNLCIIICGNVPEDDLLDIVGSWDDELPTVDSNIRKRPFLDSELSQIPGKRTEKIESTVEFPELDESQSEILISWIGEDYHAYRDDLAVSLLLDYFTETALAPFNKLLVEIEDPYANSIDYWTDDFMRSIINIGVHGVPTERLEETRDKVLDVLFNHKIDLTRMRQVIDNGKWDYVLKCEKNGDTVLSQAIISDFIYGDNSGESLKATLKDLSDFDAIDKWDQDKWQALLKKNFVENQPVIVLGKPSKNLYETLETKQSALIKQRESLSDDKKDHFRSVLRNAENNNNKPVPDTLLEKFSIDDPLKSVDFIKTKGFTNIDNYETNDSNDQLTKDMIAAKPKNFPFFVHAEHFSSQFIEIHALVNSWSIKDTSLLPFYHVFDELFSMPMKIEDGTIISYEDVVTKLKSETVDSSISLGLHGSTMDLIDFRIRCRSDNYSESVKWIKYCLYDMVFDEKRVNILLENYLNSIVELKREGDIMLESLTNRNLFTSKALKKSVDPIHVEELIEDILDDIDNGKFEKKILPKLETMRNQLRAQFSFFHILVLGDIKKIAGNFYEPWESLVNEQNDIPSDIKIQIPPVPTSLETLTNLGKNPKDVAHIVTTPASESSYMTLMTSIPFDLDYHHPDYPIVSLASEYLQCVEGPFWKGIRGSGLAYGANMMSKTDINAWAFSIYRGTDLTKCYEVGRQIVNDYASGALIFEPQLIKGAMSSIINRIATVESGYYNAALAKYVDEFLKKRGFDFNSLYLDRLSKVTVEDLQRVTKQYFVNLFDSEKSAAFVSCHPSKLDTIQEFLEKQGFSIKIEELEDDDEDDSDSDGN